VITPFLTESDRDAAATVGGAEAPHKIKSKANTANDWVNRPRLAAVSDRLVA
jgi:hypothetical protein